MELLLEGNRQALKITVIGHLAGRHCDDLRATVMSAADDGRQITLSLDRVEEFDDLALGLLIELRGLLESRNGRLLIESPSECVITALRESSLDALFGLA